MANNYIQPGDNITIEAPANVTSGAPVFAGKIVGIAMGKAAMGAAVDVATSGVFEMRKVADEDIHLGDSIFWDVGYHLVTFDDDSGVNLKLGVAVETAGESTSTVRVRLSGF